MNPGSLMLYCPFVVIRVITGSLAGEDFDSYISLIYQLHSAFSCLLSILEAIVINDILSSVSLLP